MRSCDGVTWPRHYTLSVLLAPLPLVEHDHGQPGIHPEQVKIVLDKVNPFTIKHVDAQLTAFGQKEI